MDLSEFDSMLAGNKPTERKQYETVQPGTYRVEILSEETKPTKAGDGAYMPYGQQVDGVMIGREAYHNPYLLAEMGQLWDLQQPNRFEIMQQMMPYIHQRVAEGAPLSIITRHILGLFQNLPGARKWRQALSGGNAKTIADIEHAIQNIQAAMQRTEDYLTEHQS